MFLNYTGKLDLMFPRAHLLQTKAFNVCRCKFRLITSRRDFAVILDDFHKLQPYLLSICVHINIVE